MLPHTSGYFFRGKNMSNSNKKKLKLGDLFSNPLLIIFAVITLCVILTWFVTPGAFDRVEEGGRTIVVAGSYHTLPKNPLSLFDIFRSIPYGLVGAADMMFMVLVVGGSLEVYTRTGAIDIGITRVLKVSKKFGGQLVLAIIMLLFTILGGFLGWSEQIIPFVPLIISLCLALGYDSLVGMAVCGFVNLVAFSVSPFAYATVGISQTIAELPMYSGWQFRLLVLIVMQALCWTWILRYSAKVKKDPSKSYVKDIDVSSLRKDYTPYESMKMTLPQIIAIIILFISFVVSIYGMLNLGWSTNEMAATFLAGGIISGVINRLSANDITDGLVTGAKGAIMGALIIGVARGIQWIMTEGQLIDPVVNTLANVLNGYSAEVTIIGIILVVFLMDGLIASGSGKAMALMPILIPLADMLGMTRQSIVLAYQLGDGVANTFWFTNGTMLIYMSLSKVPLKKWYKFVIPLEAVLLIAQLIFAVIAVNINYGPF